MGLVTSSKVSVIPFTGYDNSQLSVIIQTSNQSIKSQPVLWIVHGSGGVSSNDQLWADAAMLRGYAVAWVDHFSPRGIYKMNHRIGDPNLLYHYHVAIDLHNGINALVDNQHLAPFANLNNIKLLGFSSGGSTVIYAVTPEFDHTRIVKVAALYPGLWPLTSKVVTADGNKVVIYVGDDDDWTRKEHSEIFASFVKGTRLVSYTNTKHSFSKPGSGGYYADIHNVSLVPFEVPTPIEETLSFSGRYRQIYDEYNGKYFGAHSEYNADSTAKTIEDFLGPIHAKG
jgi:dienelactone hydrolase